MVALAQSGNTHEQKKSDDTHERKVLEDRLHQAQERLNAVVDIMERWEEKAGNRKATTLRWENVMKLLAELRTELQYMM